MKKNDKICIVIPAYNEAPVIGGVIKEIISSFASASLNAKVIVIDDGSKDNTATIAEKSGATVIRHILNMGAGSATATGLSYAEQNGYQLAATMDGDGQHHAQDVIKGIETLQKKEVDLLIGSRLINNKGMSRVKLIGNKGLSFITYVIFGIHSTDSQSGLRIYSKKALESLRWKTSGYEFCSEMLWRAKTIGLTIDEYPIRAIYTEYSSGKGQNNWNGFNIVKSLIRRRLSELFS